MTPAGIAQRAPFEWAQIIAGDIPAIRRYAPADSGALSGKTVIGECAGLEDVVDLRSRGVATLITTMPPLTEHGLDPCVPARWPAAVMEACMAAMLGDRDLLEGDYLNLMAELEWRPSIISLQSETGVNRFAFVIHPLSPRYIFSHRLLRRFRWLPECLGRVRCGLCAADCASAASPASAARPQVRSWKATSTRWAPRPAK